MIDVERPTAAIRKKNIQNLLNIPQFSLAKTTQNENQSNRETTSARTSDFNHKNPQMLSKIEEYKNC